MIEINGNLVDNITIKNYLKILFMNEFDDKLEQLIDSLVESPYLVKDIPQILLDDENFVSKLLEKSPSYKIFFFAYVSDTLKSNKTFMFEVIKDTPEILSFTNLQNDKGFMLSLIKQNIDFVNHIPPSLTNDRDIMLLAISYSGAKLKDVPDVFKNDKEIVMKAIESSPLMFKFASQELRDDEEVVIKATKFNHNSLVFASNRLRDDKDFALKLIHIDYKVLTYLSTRLKSDHKIALEAYKKDKGAIKLFSRELNDEIIKSNIGKENIHKYLETHVLKEELGYEINTNDLKDKKLKL